MMRSLAVAAREAAPPACRGVSGSRSRDLLPGHAEIAVLAIHLYAAAPRSFLLDASDNDVHTCARRRGLYVTLCAKGVDDVLRPRLDLSGLWVAAVIQINTDERVGATEDKPDAIIGRLSGFVDLQRFRERPPRHQVGSGRSALRPWRVGHLRQLVVALLQAPAHPLRAFGKLLRDVLGTQGNLPGCFGDHGDILPVGIVRAPISGPSYFA